VEKQEIINKLKVSRIMPIFSHEDAGVVLSVIKACYEGGLKSFEFTNRVKNAVGVFSEIQQQRKHFPDLMLGVGTVMNEADARSFIDAGADFIVSPILNPKVGAVCKQNNKVWIPGCATPTEIVTAHELGADFIKVFPASSLGPGFVSSVLSVVPGLQLMVTGGIEPTSESISSWIKSGAICVGFGSNLLKKNLIASGDWNAISKSVSDALRFANDAVKTK
jgi:2-dehydro-3-deoxyphosphogluconate aldolase / (4S)-4-hydroxy-2-oxoglutarate aldolase